MNLRIADLHTHSTCSDGAHSPAEVVRVAVATGVTIMALTDHDTIRGNAEAATESARAGIEFVPGIEISALHDGREYHILGYFVKPCPDLDSYVDVMETVRDRRLEEIVGRLNRVGLDVDVEGIREKAPGVATRAHIAAYLLERGKVGSVSEAFERYLGPGCAGHVSAAHVSVPEAIRLIHAAGGCSSLAHPGEWVSDREVLAFCEVGLDAIETVHPSHGDRLRVYHSALAQRLGLLESGGSDFHAMREDPEWERAAFYVSAERVDALRRRASTHSANAAARPESNGRFGRQIKPR